MSIAKRNTAFHSRLALLIGTEEPFRWAKRVDIPSATFARIWAGKSIPKHEHLCSIAEKCGVSLDWLLLGRGDMSSESALENKINSALIPVVGLANCGVGQGWYNETGLNCSIVVPSVLKEEGVFGVLCCGKSMVPAGIPDGAVSIIYPKREPQVGKPALIRTKAFVRGKEVRLSTIKRFESRDADSIRLTGWLDPDEENEQTPFHEKRLLSCVTEIISVGTVLEGSGVTPLSELKQENAEPVNERLLAECFNALKPLYSSLDSEKFTELFMLVYRESLKLGKADLDIVSRFAEIIGRKA